MRLSHIPLRLATGAFILNSGLAKRQLPEDAAAGMQDMAANAVPSVKDMEPATFGKALSAGEIALGAALLTPFVSPVLAGAALTGFAGGLLRMYLKTPGLTEEGSPRPTPEGTATAKDVWLLATGTALVIDGLTDDARSKARGAKKRARRASSKTRRQAHRASTATQKRAHRASKATRTRARRTATAAGKSLPRR